MMITSMLTPALLSPPLVDLPSCATAATQRSLEDAEFVFEDGDGHELDFVFFGEDGGTLCEVILPEGEDSEETRVVIDASGEVTTLTVGQEEHDVLYEDGEIVGETEKRAVRRAQEVGFGGRAFADRQLQSTCAWSSAEECEEAFDDACSAMEALCEAITDIFDNVLESSTEPFCSVSPSVCTSSSIEDTCEEACEGEHNTANGRPGSSA